MAKRISKKDLGIDDDLLSSLNKQLVEITGTTKKFEETQKALNQANLILSKGASEYAKTLKDLNVTTAQGQKEFAEKSKEANKLINDAQKLEQQQLRTKKLLEQSKQAELRTQKMINQEKGKTLTAYQKESKALNDNRNKWKDLAVQNKQNTKEGRDLLSVIGEQDAKLKAIDKTVGQNQRNVGNYTKAVSGLKNGLAQLGLAFGGFEIAKGFINLNVELDKATNTARMFFNTSAEGSKAIAKEATILGSVWGTETNEVLASANVLAKEFGLSGEEALAKINTGFSKGADVQGEFIQNIKEYSSQLTQAGLTADQSIALITQSQQQGVFSDKGVDAIKEATLSLREMTQPAQDALSAIGMSGTQLQKEIQSGQKTYFEAIQEISKKTKEFGSGSQEAGMILADVFKGAGEDAGQFIFSLDQLNLNLDKMEDVSDGVDDAVGNLKRSFLEYAFDVNEAVGFTDKFAGFLNFLAKNLGTILSLLGKVAGVFLIYKTRLIALNVAQRLFSDGAGGMNVSIKTLVSNMKEGAKAGNGFGGALKGIGWSALIGLAFELGTELYRIASGAAQAEEDMNRLAKTTEKALNSTNNNINRIKDALNSKIEGIDLKVTSGDLKDEKEILRLKNEALALAKAELTNSVASVRERKNRYLELLKEVSLIKGSQAASDTNFTKNAKRLKEIQNELKITGDTSYFGLIQDDASAVDILAQLKANINATSKSIIEYKNELSGVSLELNRNVAETKGATKSDFDHGKGKERLIEIQKERNKGLEIEIGLYDEFEGRNLEESNVLELARIEAQRLLNIAEYFRITKEIELSKAKEKNDTEAILRIEEELKQARIDEINARVGVELSESDNYEEQLKIKKQGELDIQNLNEKAIENEKKNALETQKYIEITTDFLEKQIDKRIELLNKEIEARQNFQSTLEELANNGNIQAQQSLAENAELQRQAEAEKVKQERRKQQLQIVASFLTSYNQHLESGDKAGEAFAKALTEKATLEALLASIPAFLEGTEDTGRVANPLDANGGRLAVLHDNERVLTKEQNKAIGGLSNEDVVAMVQKAKVVDQMGDYSNSGWKDAMLVSELNGLRTDMKAVKKAIEDKPETNYNVEGIVNGVMHLTKVKKQGSSITFNRFKIS